MSNVEKAGPPVRWVVVVSATDPATGGHVSKSHECRDLLHARILLTDLRDLAAEFGPYLPGLSVEGYEVGETVSVTPAGQAALVAANPLLAAVAGWLAE